jgi:hypothetical protein
LYGVALPQGFDIIKWCFYIFFFYICCGDFVFGIGFLTSGIRALSLADIVGKYFLFLQIFFRRRKKRATTFHKFLVYLCVKIVEKGCISEFLLKNTQFEKKNRPKQSPGSQDIEVLKSANFQGFFRGRRHNVFFLFIYVADGGQIFPNKLQI